MFAAFPGCSALFILALSVSALPVLCVCLEKKKKKKRKTLNQRDVILVQGYMKATTAILGNIRFMSDWNLYDTLSDAKYYTENDCMTNGQ